jgi:hypothetical protein
MSSASASMIPRQRQRQRHVVLLCAALAAVVAPAGVSAEPNKGICRMQIEADVEKRFQQKITSIEFTYITGKGGRGEDLKSTALVYTNACPGYHGYDVYATEYDCEFRVQFGKAPNHIRYRVSGGGC